MRINSLSDEFNTVCDLWTLLMHWSPVWNHNILQNIRLLQCDPDIEVRYHEAYKELSEHLI